jgi:hypothetical protein
MYIRFCCWLLVVVFLYFHIKATCCGTTRNARVEYCFQSGQRLSCCYYLISQSHMNVLHERGGIPNVNQILYMRKKIRIRQYSIFTRQTVSVNKVRHSICRFSMLAEIKVQNKPFPSPPANRRAYRRERDRCIPQTSQMSPSAFFPPSFSPSSEPFSAGFFRLGWFAFAGASLAS